MSGHVHLPNSEKNLFPSPPAGMTTTLPLFWNLSSNSRQERLDASVKLVGALENFQSNFVPSKTPQESSSEEDEENDEGAPVKDNLDSGNAPDVSYSLRRLVRGLASPRESSRLGFAVALTEVRSIFLTLNYIDMNKPS